MSDCLRHLHDAVGGDNDTVLKASGRQDWSDREPEARPMEYNRLVARSLFRDCFGPNNDNAPAMYLDVE